MVMLEHPLRVLHIVSGDLWAGAETQVFTLISQLQLSVSPKVIVLNPGELADRLRQLNIPLIILPEATMSSVQIFWQLLKIIYTFRPHIVHTHRQKENILGGFAFAFNRLLGRASVSVRTVHGAPEFIPTGIGRVQDALNTWVGKYIQSRLVAVSEDLRQKLLAKYTSKQLTLVRNGVDERALRQCLQGENITETGFNIGIVGRLEPVKRVDLFLAMAAHLNKIAPDIPWRFHIIGDGILANELKQLAVTLGLTECVKFYGQVSPVAPHLAKLQMIVMCSDHEGTPMVALEAQALGIPLIAHRVGGLEELLRAEPRLLVTEHTAQGYAAKVLEYINAPFSPPPLPEEYRAEQNALSMVALYNHLLSAAA